MTDSSGGGGGEDEDDTNELEVALATNEGEKTEAVVAPKSGSEIAPADEQVVAETEKEDQEKQSLPKVASNEELPKASQQHSHHLQNVPRCICAGGILGCIVIIGLLIGVVVVVMQNPNDEDTGGGVLLALEGLSTAGLSPSPSTEGPVYVPSSQPAAFSSTPTPALTDALTAFPVASELPWPSTAPSVSSPAFSVPCAPTFGSCLSNKNALVEALQIADAGDTVEICSNSFLVLDQPISIFQDNVTLCSQATSVLGSLSSQILQIYGNSVTLRGVIFMNLLTQGAANEQTGGASDLGGLVAIRAAATSDGMHTIDTCWFYGGSARLQGGNLYVETQANLVIQNSTFVSGSAQDGGGLAVTGKLGVLIEDCLFHNNQASSSGGALFATSSPLFGESRQNITVLRTTFDDNTAFWGGAILATAIGELPSARLQMNVFTGNQAEEAGGVAAILHYGLLESIELILEGNTGDTNTADDCSTFLLFLDQGSQVCFALNRFYTPAPSLMTVSPAPYVSSDFDTLLPSISLTRSPSSLPPSIPGPPVPSLTCAPTVGPCVASNFELVESLANADHGDTVEICSFNSVILDEPLLIWEDNITLCCRESCTLSSLSNQILNIYGSFSTLRGVTFASSNLQLVARQLPIADLGGLVSIRAQGQAGSDGGVHTIDSCRFEGGSAFLQGGNLYVEGTRAELLIRNSTFLSGLAQDGGGLAVTGLPRVRIEDCLFQSNRASSNGGAVFVTTSAFSEMSGQDITVLRTAFVNNSAVFGGAILATAIGEMPALRIQMSSFVENQAEDSGGLAAVFHYDVIENIELVLDGNTGGGNDAGDCFGFYLFLSRGESVCFELNQFFTPSPTPMAISSVPVFASHAPLMSGSPTPTQDVSVPPFVPAPSFHSQSPRPTSVADPAVCVPTAGSCITTLDELVDSLGRSGVGHVIAICSPSQFVVSAREIHVAQDYLTICCLGSDCSFVGSGRILEVYGTGVALVGLQFLHQSDGVDRRITDEGGLVRIESPGDHLIHNCTFRGGRAYKGGNLYIQSIGQVTVQHSSFFNGFAQDEGGALVVADADTLAVAQCLFHNNTAPFGAGGGFMTYLFNTGGGRGQDISIVESVFEYNSATFGGAFVASSMGEMPSLNVLRSTFFYSYASDYGGIGAVFHYDNVAKLVMYFNDNTGTNNLAASVCSGILIYTDGPIPLCVNVFDDYVPAPAFADFPSPHPTASYQPVSSPVYIPSSTTTTSQPGHSFAPYSYFPFSASPSPSFESQDREDDAREFLTSIGYTPDTVFAESALQWIAVEDELQVQIPLSSSDANAGAFLQRYALVVLYYTLDGYRWKKQLNFLSPWVTCDWHDASHLYDPTVGVQCNAYNEVTDILLANNDHVGQLPNEVGLLTTLTRLDLSFGQLTGTIPVNFYDLTSLVSVHLEYNVLLGIIMENIGTMTGLADVWFSNNLLSGTLPFGLANLKGLNHLAIDNNIMTGSVNFLRQVPDFRRLFLDHNWFDGPLGLFENGILTNLEQFDISHNKITGSIPEVLMSHPFMEVVDIGFNQMTGTIPMLWPNGILRAVSLAGNRISGTIPESVVNLYGLVHLDLSSNVLSGTVPPSILVLTGLEYLFLGENPFVPSTIPSGVAQMGGLRELSLRDSNMVGTIPSELGAVERLHFLDLSYNMLTGTLPDSLAGLSDLRFLVLNRNDLKGPISPQFDGKRLSVAFLDHNEFTGTVPLCNNPIEALSSDCDMVDCPCCHICCARQDNYEECNSATGAAVAEISWENNFKRSEFDLGPNLLVAADPAFTKPPIFPSGSSPPSGSPYGAPVISPQTLLPSPFPPAPSPPTPFPTSTAASPAITDIELLYSILSQTAVGAPSSDSAITAAEWIVYEDMWCDSVPLSPTSPLANAFFQRYGVAVVLIALRGDDWFIGHELFPTTHECDWSETLLDESVGLLCDSNRRVHEISINGSVGDHEAFIPPEIGLVSALTTLEFSDANVKGTLPSQLFSLLSLETLILDENDITGELSNEIRALLNLTSLSLSRNSFVGNLPSSLVRNWQLSYLAVDSNFFTGPIGFLDNLQSLRFLYLNGNLLNGVISFFDPSGMASLQEFDASDNDMTGVVSEAFVKHPALRRVDLSENRLAGTLPEFEPNEVLELLSLSGGFVHGTIPPSLSNLEKLTYLDLSGNDFMGTLPENAIAQLTNLEALFVAHVGNVHAGPIPDGLSYLSDLVAVSLRGTGRTGTIPTWFGLLTSLEYLDLSYNQLVGEVPTEISQLAHLEYLMLNRNQIEGEFPPGLDRPMNVVMLDHTNLTGPIPCFGDDIEILAADVDVVQCPCCNACCFQFGPSVVYELCNDMIVAAAPPNLKGQDYFNYTRTGIPETC